MRPEPSPPNPTAPARRPAGPVFPPGFRLDQFQIVGLLGRGGMGAVYEAVDTLLGRRVAIKVVGPTEGDPDLRRLLKEARAVAKLDHPNVVRIYHVGRCDRGYYLVLELVRGGSLKARLDPNRPLAWERATAAVADACRGLAAAHAAGLVHRDIKPANLMCDEAGTVKVTDFGLVRGADLSASTSGHITGTPHYMSPEQCRGDPADERSDVYALGATYCALLTGRPPFPRRSAVEVMFAHCTAAVPDPRAVRPDVPAGCAAVVRRAMAKDPADRYQSAAELLAALTALTPPAESAPLELPPPAETAEPDALSFTTFDLAPVRRPAPRASRLPAVLAGLAFAVVVGVSAWFASKPRMADTGRDGGSKPTPAVKDDDNRPGPDGAARKGPAGGIALPDGGREFAPGGKVAAVAFSPIGNLFAAGVAEPPPGAADHPMGATVWDVTTGEVVAHLGRGERVPCLAFNRGPDGAGGETVALVRGGDNGPRIWHRNTGAEERYALGWKPEFGRVTAVGASDRQSFAIGYSAGELSGQVHQYKWGGNTLPGLAGGGGTGVRQILFAHNGMVAVVYDSGKVRHWEKPWQEGAERREVPGNRTSVVAYSPTAPLLARSLGREIALWQAYRWDWVDPRRAPRPEEPWVGSAVTALAYSPDGKYLAVGEERGDVTLWRVEPGVPIRREQVHAFPRHDGAVLTLAFSPDGRTLGTGAADGKARLHDAGKVLDRLAAGKP